MQHCCPPLTDRNITITIAEEDALIARAIKDLAGGREAVGQDRFNDKINDDKSDR